MLAPGNRSSRARSKSILIAFFLLMIVVSAALVVVFANGFRRPATSTHGTMDTTTRHERDIYGVQR